MARTCVVCTHERREAIDRDLIERRGSRRAIGRRYQIDEGTLRSHERRHLATRLAQAAARDELTNERMLLRIERLVTRLERACDRAEEAGDDAKLFAAAKEARPALELLAKAQGVIATGGAVTVNIAVQNIMTEFHIDERELREIVQGHQQIAALSPAEQLARGENWIAQLWRKTPSLALQSRLRPVLEAVLREAPEAEIQAEACAAAPVDRPWRRPSDS